MIDGRRICEEFVPINWNEMGIGSDIETLEDGSQVICTVCEYKHLSALALRMFDAGFLINETEGSITSIAKETDSKELTKGFHENPTLLVSFRPMEEASAGQDN